jgi:hypothetical protein
VRVKRGVLVFDALTALCVSASALAAQTPSREHAGSHVKAAVPVPVSAPAEEASPSPVRLPVQGMRPVDVVARLARKALTSPAEAGAWKDLAGALPEMALGDDADLEGTLAAARLADSLAAGTSSATDPVASAPDDAVGRYARGWPRLFAFLPGSPVSRAGLGWALAGLVLAVTTVVVWRLVARSRGSRGTRRPPNGRFWTARALAGGGTQLREIARRTGMAQEAVDLALRLTGGSALPTPTPAPRRAMVPAPRAGRGDGEAAGRRLRRELTTSVRDLRDGRLTYGGGVR